MAKVRPINDERVLEQFSSNVLKRISIISKGREDGLYGFAFTAQRKERDDAGLKNDMELYYSMIDPIYNQTLDRLERNCILYIGSEVSVQMINSYTAVLELCSEVYDDKYKDIEEAVEELHVFFYTVDYIFNSEEH